MIWQAAPANGSDIPNFDRATWRLTGVVHPGSIVAFPRRLASLAGTCAEIGHCKISSILHRKDQA